MIKPFVGPLLLLIIAIVGWAIEYLNTRKTNTSRPKLRWFLLILLVLAGAWAIYLAYQDAEEKDKTEHKLDEIAEAVKRLGINPKKLLERYTLGYVIFELDYRNEVYPYDNQLIDDYEIDWDVVAFNKLTPDRYELRLPEIKRKGGSKRITNVIISGPKKVVPWDFGDFGACYDELLALGRILDIKKDGIVFVVGFTECPIVPGDLHIHAESSPEKP